MYVATHYSTLNMENAYFHSVQNLSYFCLLSTNVKNKIHITIILHVVLYKSLTLRKEQKLTLFEKRATRKEVKRGWGKMHTETHHNLHCLPNILMIRLRSVRGMRHVACIRQKRNTV
jgi:hypothetical protein